MYSIILKALTIIWLLIIPVEVFWELELSSELELELSPEPEQMLELEPQSCNWKPKTSPQRSCKCPWTS